jgi:acyl carrier protein
MNQQHTKESIFHHLRAAIATQLKVAEQDISLASTLTSLGVDSLDTVELIMRIEDDFNLEIADEDAEQFTSLESIVDYIYAQLPAQAKE